MKRRTAYSPELLSLHAQLYPRQRGRHAGGAEHVRWTRPAPTILAEAPPPGTRAPGWSALGGGCSVIRNAQGDIVEIELPETAEADTSKFVGKQLADWQKAIADSYRPEPVTN